MTVGCGGGGTLIVAANAGPDQEVLINAVATLDGASTTGGTSFQWTFTSRPDGSASTLTNATTLSPTFTPDVAGDYIARLSVNDNESSDTVTIAAVNALVAITVPTDSAITTRDRLGVSENVIDLNATGGTLSASGSQVAALKLKNTDIVYSWEQIGGPKATLAGTSTDTLTLTAPSIGALQNQRGLYTNESTGLQQITADSYKWQILPISRNDTKMTFRLTINSADSANIDVYLQDNGVEIHPTSGLPNVGVETKVYLSGATYVSAPSTAYISGTRTANSNGTQYTTWKWTMRVPEGSSATFYDSGTTTSTMQFPTFIPDVPGLYTVTYCAAGITDCLPKNTAGTASTSNAMAYFYSDPYASKGTNIVAPGIFIPGTIYINAGTYVGVGTIGGTTPGAAQCANCHDGTDKSGQGFGDMVGEWEGTLHSHIFEDNITTYQSLIPEPYLWQYHTVGFNNDAASDGFDDLAAAFNFTFPADGITFSEFTTNNSEVAALANVQCENCHGPGSEHQGDPLRIAKSSSQAGICGQCHIEEDQWKLSLHSSVSTYGWQTWLTNPTCIKCHTSEGFQIFMENGGVDDDETAVDAVTAAVDVKDADENPGVFGTVPCQSCHDPHDATNDFHLRTEGTVTLLKDGTTIDAGLGAICYECHTGNRQLNTMDCYDDTGSGIQNTKCATWDDAATNYAGGGYHDVTQGPMLEGKQAFTDLNGDGTNDWTASENSFHSTTSFTLAAATGDSTLTSQNNKCVTCHMSNYAPAPTEPGYGQVGGHSFQMVSDIEDSSSGSEEGAEAGTVQNVQACQVCHGDKLTDFNRLARGDYDGDGTIEGIQDEVQSLMVKLSAYIQSLDTTHVQQTYDDTWTTAADCATDADCGSSSQGQTGSCNTTEATIAAMATPTGTRSTAAHKCAYFHTLTGDYLKSDGTFVGGDLAIWGNSAVMYPASVNGTAGLACGMTITNGVATAVNCSNLNTYAADKLTSVDAGKNCTTVALPAFTAATSKAALGYKTCNYLNASDTIKRALWNLNSVYRDESYGIHNAAYTIQVLQGTYAAVGKLLGGETSTFTYKSDYPNATLR